MPALRLAVSDIAASARFSPQGRHCRSFLLLIACVLWNVAGCVHDIEKLRAERSDVAAGSSSKPGPQAGTAAGSGGRGNDLLAACQPCQPPSGLSELVTPIACCTTSKVPQCGVSFGGDRCFVRHAPGLPESSCPELMRAGIKFNGCCGFDLQCGITLDALELGCMSREAVPVLLGGPLAPRSCVPKCSKDEDCSSVIDVSICVEDASHRAENRICAQSCRSDRDCAAVSDTVCAIQQNKTELRIDSVCRKAIGTGKFGDPCTSPEDCIHGVCLAQVGYCSELCRTDLECAGAGSQCKPSMIPVPQPGTAVQTFNICVLKK